MRLPICDFWDITPYEFSIIVEGYRNSVKQQIDMQIINAYNIAKLVWAKKLPPLEKLISHKEEKQEKMSDNAMYNMAVALNRIFGGKEIKRNEV